MSKKVQRKTGIHRRVFKTSEDVFQFEDERFRKEITKMGMTLTPKKVPKGKYKMEGYFYDPKTKDFIYIKPNEPDREEYITSHHLIPALKYYADYLKEIPKKMVKDPDKTFWMETDPIIFNSKGKTPPSVPFLRVYVESSLGSEESVHFMLNRARSNKR